MDRKKLWKVMDQVRDDKVLYMNYKRAVKYQIVSVVWKPHTFQDSIFF